VILGIFKFKRSLLIIPQSVKQLKKK